MLRALSGVLGVFPALTACGGGAGGGEPRPAEWNRGGGRTAGARHAMGMFLGDRLMAAQRGGWHPAEIGDSVWEWLAAGAAG